MFFLPKPNLAQEYGDTIQDGQEEDLPKFTFISQPYIHHGHSLSPTASDSGDSAAPSAADRYTYSVESSVIRAISFSLQLNSLTVFC